MFIHFFQLHSKFFPVYDRHLLFLLQPPAGELIIEKESDRKRSSKGIDIISPPEDFKSSSSQHRVSLICYCLFQYHSVDIDSIWNFYFEIDEKIKFAYL